MLLDLDAIAARLRAEIPPAQAAAIHLLVEPQTPKSHVAGQDNLLLLARVSTQVDGPQGLGRGRTLTERIAVIVQVLHRKQDQGRGADLDGTALREAVITALDGWRPGEDWTHLRYDGGRLFEAEPPLYRWADLFVAQRAHYLTSAC